MGYSGPPGSQPGPPGGGQQAPHMPRSVGGDADPLHSQPPSQPPASRAYNNQTYMEHSEIRYNLQVKYHSVKY